MNLHPLAYTREAERLVKLSRRAELESDWRLAARLARLAEDMRKRAN